MAAASCSTPEKHHRKGDMFFAHGEYFDAAAEYKTAYTSTPRSDKEARGNRAFLMGECYRRINSVSKAEGAYRNAVRYNYVDTTTYFWLAETQRMSGNYKAAQSNYELYLEQNPGDRRALTGLQSCTLAPQMKETGSNYSVHAMQMFSSRRADYSPVLFGEKSDQLIFSSTRPQAAGDEESGITGMKNGDLFYTAKDEKGKWKPVEALGGSVNTTFDEGAAAITPDGQTMYFTYCATDPQYPRYAEIYSSSRSDATWSKPQKVTITADTLSSYAHPAVSPDGKWLYFVSDMPGGIGGLDIWRMQLDEHGSGVLENLGEPVNTPGDEMFPTFRFNGDMYFSSNGHPGMGGLDIYRARHDSVSNKWSVEIMPSPINSSGDDFGMTFEGIHNRGYFSSNRKNGRGWDHIFSFERPETVQSIAGWVYEQDGYELPQSTVYMIGNDGTNMKFGLRGDGSFEQAVKPGVKYVLLATCDGYLNYKQEITVDSSEVSTCDTLYFPLPSTESPVLVRNVFYEFNSATLTDDSRQSLDKLAQLLGDNANITIELSSHCDYRGNELYNRKLSQHRAESVVNYLIGKGISPDRLTAVGYGKLRPKVVTKRLASSYKYLHEGDTLTEKYIRKLKESEQDTCNALNRRTEFRVLKTTYGLFDDNGNIDSHALLGGKTETQKAKAEPLVKVYIPTAAEAAAADGLTLEQERKKLADSKRAENKQATVKPSAKSATAAKNDSTSKKEAITKKITRKEVADKKDSVKTTGKKATVKKDTTTAPAATPKAAAKAETPQKKTTNAGTAKAETAKETATKADAKATPAQKTAKNDSTDAEKQKQQQAKTKEDSIQSVKAKQKTEETARAKADSIKKAAVTESAANASNSQTTTKATTSANTKSATPEKASKQAKAAKGQNETEKKLSKTEKQKLKAQEKAKADSIKTAQKKAKAEAKAKAKAEKAKAKAEKAKAKAAKKNAKNAKTSAKQSAVKATVKKTTPKSAATTKAATSAKKAATQKSATKNKAADTKATSAKATEKKMTMKEREAVRDSIIAKAKRDAEAEKAQKAKKTK